MDIKRPFIGSRQYWWLVVAAVTLMTATWSLLVLQERLSEPAVYLLVITHAPLVLMAILAPLVRQRLV